MTRYLTGFRFYSLPREIRRHEGTRTIFEVQQLLNETEYKKQGIRAAILDAMPRFLHRPRRRERRPIRKRPDWDVFLNSTPVPGNGAGVTVAVIDADGFDLDHPALMSAFVSGGAAFFDGSPLYILDSTSTPTSSSRAAHGTSGGLHGTRCAGIIGARQNQLNSIVGFAPGCSILPLYVHGYIESLVAAAIKYAANNNAQVISISDSTVGMNGSVDTEIQYANTTKKVLICAATMNNNANTILHPAAHPSVMACGASNISNDRCNPGPPPDWNSTEGSNYGDNMSVVAPGMDIQTTNFGGGYTTFDGTSAATPQVAALATILISTFSALTNNPSLTREIIERSAQKLGRTTVGPPPGNTPVNPPNPALAYSTIRMHGGWEREMGYGIISLQGAIQKAQELLAAGGDTTAPAAPTNLRIL